HYIFLDRGPLWLEGQDTPENIRDFFTAFNAQFPQRLGRMRRIMPELPATENSRALLAACGCEYKGAGYQSIWLDLAPTEAELRAGLHGKWRNRLNAAERKNLTTQEDPQGHHLPWFLQTY